MEIKVSFWIRLFLPFFLVIFLVSFAYLLSLFEELPGFDWYIIVWFALSIFMVCEIGWKVNRYLDNSCKWNTEPFRRLILQLSITSTLGVSLLVILLILMNIYENTFTSYKNPLSVHHVLAFAGQSLVIVQLINSFQIGYSLLKSWSVTRLELEKIKQETMYERLESLRHHADQFFPMVTIERLRGDALKGDVKIVPQIDQLIDSIGEKLEHMDSEIRKIQDELSGSPDNSQEADSPENEELKSKVFKQRFLVKTGLKMRVIDIDEVVAFYKDDIVLLVNSNNARFPVDQSIEELTNSLTPEQFFKINRQTIINLKYIREVHQEGKFVKVLLKNNESAIPLTVSQRNIPAFKHWLEGNA